MRLTKNCPICGKTLELESESRLGDEIIKAYKCGHGFSDQILAAMDPNKLIFESIDGKKKARNYQEAGVEFLLGCGDFESYGEKRGQCAILADQMRIGKTPQSLIATKNLIEQAREKGESFPVLVLCRAANIYQWIREVWTWIDNKPDAVWLIQGTKSWVPPGFQVYVCSMDTFSRKGMSDSLLEFGFKLVIADEAHSFKNTDSQRSQSLTAFLKNIERSTLEQDWDFQCPFCKERWTEKVTINVNTLEADKKTTKTSHCPKCFSVCSQSAATHVKVTRNCSIFLLTGTPIKNRADEYFVPLNLVAPERFPSLQNFRRRWLVQDAKGKFSRVAPYAYDAFMKEIAPYVLRREKEDVYKDIPKLNRIFTPIEISDQRLKDAYNKVLDRIETKLTNEGNFNYFTSIGELQILRQICGMAKVNFTADYVETFLMDSDKQKLAIGVHHHSVRDAMRLQLANFGVYYLDGTHSPSEKDRIAHRYFEKAPEQILVLGMMAAKEGIELVYVDTAIVMEREWSSADEEQFEYRFYNPDLGYLKSRGLENKVTNIEYIIAKGTIDEFFYDLVEEKRSIFGETLSKNWDVTSDSTSFKELMERTVAGRLK